MKRKIVVILLIVSFSIVLFSGCASKSESSDEKGYAGDMVAETTKGQTKANAIRQNDSSLGLGGSSEDGEKVSLDKQFSANNALSNRKVILNANVSIEVEDFDSAYTKIKTMIAPYGYVQQTNIRKDKYYPDGTQEYIYVTNGVIVIRVDHTEFERTMRNLSGIGTITSEDRGSDDITYKYTDTKARIKLLEQEKARLEKYLKDETKDAEFIMETQSRITNILYQIESYKGNIQRWDDLISLSTVTIDMREKIPGQKHVEEYTFWDKMYDSLEEAINICGSVLIFIVSAIPVLLVLGGIFLIIFFVIRWVVKLNGKNKEYKYHNIDNKKDNTNNPDTK